MSIRPTTIPGMSFTRRFGGTFSPIEPLVASGTTRYSPSLDPSLVESTMALICSCAPALKPLFRYLVPLAQRVTARASSSAPKTGSSLGSSVYPRKPPYRPSLVVSGKSEDVRFGDGSYLELSPTQDSSSPYTLSGLESHAYYQERDKGSLVQSAVGHSAIMKTVSVDIQPHPSDKPGRLSLFPPPAGR